MAQNPNQLRNAGLWLNHNLPPQLGEDPEQITREVARYLF
jgi:hypothetical protein